MLSASPAISYYAIIACKALVRVYFVYLIYSFYARVDRGETLLVEYGRRKLSKMIDEIREDENKHEWDLELTERNAGLASTSRV